MTQNERLIFLIKYLLSKSERYRNIDIPSDITERKNLFRSLVNIRTPKAISDDFIKIQDESLQGEIAEIGITDADTLLFAENKISLWQGDITVKTGEEISDIEYELIPCDGFIGSEEFDLDKTIYDLNSQIKLLSSQADKLDYIVAIASGIACGILDILWVGDFDLTNGRNFVSYKVDDFVKKIAEMLEGKKMNDVKSAVKALEKRFPIPSDGNTPDFGGGLQHHFRDFAHHPTIAGLAFSLLTQFTEKSYGTDANGVFLVVDIKEKSKPFIGKDVSQKILMGTITWFFHLVSDVAGSSGTAGVTGGTGIPGPILALAKEISVIPFFKDIKVGDDMPLSLFLSKLFNGTLMMQRDENGQIPMLCFHASALTFTSMQPTGQSFAHLPQPTQRSASTAA